MLEYGLMDTLWQWFPNRGAGPLTGTEPQPGSTAKLFFFFVPQFGNVNIPFVNNSTFCQHLNQVTKTSKIIFNLIF